RRRHTRFSRDWSSDVCSSDLTARSVTPSSSASCRHVARPRRTCSRQYATWLASARWLIALLPPSSETDGVDCDECHLSYQFRVEIGRASCRERGRIWGLCGSL